MTTISNALLNNAGSAASTLAGQPPAQGTSSATNTAQIAQSAIQGKTIFTPSVANQSASLTYTSAGTVHSTPQTQASAQAAYIAAETAMTQSLSDLMSGSSGASSTDMLGASTSSTTNSSTGLLNNLPSSVSASTASVATDTKAQVAQKAYMAAQDAVTQAQWSLIA